VAADQLLPYENSEDYEIENFMRGEINKFNKLKK
jgi:hypothetical protein